MLWLVGSSSARSDVVLEIQAQLSLFLFPAQVGQDGPDDVGCNPVSPRKNVSGSPGFDPLGPIVPSCGFGDLLDGGFVAHDDFDSRSVLISDRTSFCGEFVDPEASLSVHQSGGVSCQHWIADDSALMGEFGLGALVQRLFLREVGASAPKGTVTFLHSDREVNDIVSSALKDAAAITIHPNDGGVGVASDVKIRTYMGDEYMAIAWPTTFRQMKNDLESVYQYRDQGFQMIYNGEIGKFEGVRFIEQTNVSKGKYNSSTRAFTAWSQALSDWIFFFGEDTVAEAIVVPEEMRGAIPSDFGRSRGVAWYYLGGFAITQTQAAQARVVMWDSAV